MKVTVTEPGKTEQQRALGQQIPGQQIPGQPELQDQKEPEHPDHQATAGKSHNINFTEDSYILWPVNGAVIMSYSMDKTVYFQTLDQYKYNPAVIIEGAEGDQVLCGAPGIVKSIDVSAQTGTTVKVGDYVEAKSVLGYVSQPTKYYSKEGCNVYFEMRKDGQPVNPVEYTADQD